MTALPTVQTPAVNPYEPKKPTGVSTLNQADFLKLLTAQLKNQDPTEPVDNAQFVSQMAQFSTVNGIEQLNGGLKALTDRLGAGELAGAAALIGRRATVAAADGTEQVIPITGLALADGAISLRLADGRSVRPADVRAVTG